MTPPNALPPQLIEVSALTVSRGGRPLFEGLDLTLGRHETVLLTGPNGVGKTSLLLALAGILRPDAGRIGWQTGERPDLHLVGHAAGVKARLTVLENVRFWQALNGATGIAPDAALERVGLARLAGLEAGHLSAGQTRRLALARLLVSERAVWLLDEPTASLDTAGTALVADLLRAHRKAGGGAIVATHDPEPLDGTRRLALEAA